MKKIAVAVLLLFVALTARAQTNGQAYPPDTGPYRTGQYILLPQIAPPMVPQATAAPTTGTGTTSYFYWIVTTDNTNSGAQSIPAGPFFTNIGPASLAANQGIKISFQPFTTPLTYGQDSPGHYGPLTANNVTYDVLETSDGTPPTGACNCAVAIGIGNGTVVDTGTYQTYTVQSQVWPIVMGQENDAVQLGPGGMIIDSGFPFAPSTPLNCTASGPEKLAFVQGTSPVISCSTDWLLTNPDGIHTQTLGIDSASGNTGGFNIQSAGLYKYPDCRSGGATVSDASLQFCGNTSDGNLHFWNRFTNTDVVIGGQNLFLNTTGPLGVTFNVSGPDVSATLAGAGFGPAGVPTIVVDNTFGGTNDTLTQEGATVGDVAVLASSINIANVPSVTQPAWHTAFATTNGLTAYNVLGNTHATSSTLNGSPANFAAAQALLHCTSSCTVRQTLSASSGTPLFIGGVQSGSALVILSVGANLFSGHGAPTVTAVNTSYPSVIFQQVAAAFNNGHPINVSEPGANILMATGMPAGGQSITVTLTGNGVAFNGQITVLEVTNISGLINGHSAGLVPDPGSTAHNPPYYLGDDNAWHSTLGSLQSRGSLTPSCLTTNTANATCTSTVTFAPAQPDTNYIANCSGMGIIQFPFIAGTTPLTGTTVQVTISNGQASAAQISGYSTVGCVITSLD